MLAVVAFWLRLLHQKLSNVCVCLLRVMLKSPQACRCLFARLTPGERGKECGADGTHCLERFWEAGVVVEPPQPGSHPGKCSHPPSNLPGFPRNLPPDPPAVVQVLICPSKSSHITPPGFCMFFPTLKGVFCDQEGLAQANGRHVL